jgi:hypothetical protein
MSCCDIFFNETLCITFNESIEVKNVSCTTYIETALHGTISWIHRHIIFTTKLLNTTLIHFTWILLLFSEILLHSQRRVYLQCK